MVQERVGITVPEVSAWTDSHVGCLVTLGSCDLSPSHHCCGDDSGRNVIKHYSSDFQDQKLPSYISCIIVSFVSNVVVLVI